jgi:type VI secretion system protein ImpA
VLQPDESRLDQPPGAPEPVPNSPAPTGAGGSEPDIDAAIALLCSPIEEGNPCGPDLDEGADTEYLNFFAQVEGILPASFFSAEDGSPFDRSSVDLTRHRELIKPLLQRTRDIRLLIMQARLEILDQDLMAFARSVAAVAQLLESFWDQVHPRCHGDDASARVMAIAALDASTVTFPLQYSPLFEARRMGAVTYRAYLIACGDVKPRGSETKLNVAAIIEARGETDPDVLVHLRQQIARLKGSLARIQNSFAIHGASADLNNLPALVAKMQAFVDPAATETRAPADPSAERDADADAIDQGQNRLATDAAGAPTTLSGARDALAAIAEYYEQCEPSSPTLPLIRQAHQLIGKSFLEVISILVPGQLEKAAFQIGGDQVFELPVGKLGNLSKGSGEAVASQPSAENPARYQVRTRAQAIALLEQVQGFFRRAEPGSPVPIICERARALAERDFMAVLRDVLPKAALKNIGTEK